MVPLLQDYVSTVVKASEDDDPIAIMTVLNTSQHSKLECMAAVRGYILGKCKEGATKEKLQRAWDAKDTGLIINERLINCPPKLAPPMMQSLVTEIEAAAEEEAEFRFKQYLVFSRVYSDLAAGSADNDAAAGPSSSKAGGSVRRNNGEKRAKLAAAPTAAAAAVVYVRPEDEFLHQHSDWSFTFPIENRPVGKNELQPLRIVMAISAKKVEAARMELDAVVGNAMAEVE